MTEVEVLELNADGEFEIPSPTTRIEIEVDEDSDDGEPGTFSPTSKPIVEMDDNGVLDYVSSPEEKFKDLVGDILPGEFKIYEPDPSLVPDDSRNRVMVFIRMEPGEKPQKLEVLQESVELTTSKERTLVVKLEEKVDNLTAISSAFEDLLFVSMEQEKTQKQKRKEQAQN